MEVIEVTIYFEFTEKETKSNVSYLFSLKLQH